MRLGLGLALSGHRNSVEGQQIWLLAWGLILDSLLLCWLLEIFEIAPSFFFIVLSIGLSCSGGR
jgi:hypothetical protein